ncbi:hypothetical protein O7542_13770 [Micromonospora sp. WMMC264]|uniref:hypothetical protein n=1 Tax=Micromonospora sp. WMMC264 TaxID=3015158 RepID=UPI00248BD1E0|nr:hypothetical protein [Micromonospora sp. WMMC264]WBB88170.1 hypothetical protein O7542_13770 [Micromonospora sp. WMMC264]
MAAASWIPVVSTALGAVIALGGGLLAGARNDRGQRRRDRESDRLKTYVDFALALDTAHAALREVARTPSGDASRRVAASAAVHESGLYGVRERLLMSGSPALVVSGEAAFGRLIDIRNAVRSGVMVSTTELHDVYHPFAQALWRFRIVARVELGQRELSPGDLDREDWSERAGCALCGQISGPPAL